VVRASTELRSEGSGSVNLAAAAKEEAGAHHEATTIAPNASVRMTG
jgi:hypothetical protein